MTDSRSLPSLNSGGTNWVTEAGGLPDYIERIAKHLHFEKGKPKGEAIAIAVNVAKKQCATGDLNFPGLQHITAATKEEACQAVAEWNAKRAKAHAAPNKK